jgi:hypothetical protein
LHQADAADHAISRCHALAQAMCPVTLWTGDLPAAERCVAMLIEVASDNALEGWIVRGQCFNGLLLLQRGETMKDLFVWQRRCSSSVAPVRWRSIPPFLRRWRMAARLLDKLTRHGPQSIKRSADPKLVGSAGARPNCFGSEVKFGFCRMRRTRPPPRIVYVNRWMLHVFTVLCPGNCARQPASFVCREMAAGVRKRVSCSPRYLSATLKALRLPTLCRQGYSSVRRPPQRRPRPELPPVRLSCREIPDRRFSILRREQSDTHERHGEFQQSARRS